jgi:hypothetical protein
MNLGAPKLPGNFLNTEVNISFSTRILIHETGELDLSSIYQVSLDLRAFVQRKTLQRELVRLLFNDTVLSIYVT